MNAKIIHIWGLKKQNLETFFKIDTSFFLLAELFTTALVCFRSSFATIVFVSSLT